MAACRSRLWIGRSFLETNHSFVRMPAGEEKSIARMVCTGSRKYRSMSKEKRVEAVKAFVGQYMLQFPGKFPALYLVRKEVGGTLKVLKPTLEELKITRKTSLDQKQSEDANEGALEAVRSIAPKNLSIYAKSNDATVMESNGLDQNDLLYSNKISGIGLPNNKKQTLFQVSEKQFIVEKEDPSIAPHPNELQGANLPDKQENTSLHSSDKKGGPVKISGMGGNIDLPDNHEKTLLQSSNEKQEQVKISATGENILPLPFSKITSEKADRNANNEDYSSVVHTKELSSTSIESNNPELNKLKGGFPVRASTVLEELKVEKNENKEVNSSTIASNIRNLFATNLKLVPKQTTKGGPSMNAQDVIQYAEVDNKEVRGSTVPKIVSLFRRPAAKVDNNTQIRKKLPVKQVDPDQRNRRLPSTYTLQSHKISDEEREGDSDYAAFDYPEPDGNNQIRKKLLMKQVDPDQKNRRLPSTYTLQSHKISDEETEDDSDYAAFDYPEPDGNNQSVITRTNFKLDKAGLSEKPKSQESLLIKFLPLSATKQDLCIAFGDCGSITQVHIIPSRREESRFNYASIIFKTREGFQKALLKKDVVVSGGEVVLEALSSYNQNLCQDFTPSTVKKRAVPMTEIKNPCFTVMIKDLPQGLNFKQFKNALTFCGTVTSITMGLSKSNIYITFKTEEAKERALMAHWISIDGHQLQIRRVDAPRTPVVRISNVSSEIDNKKILNICQSFGCVKRVEHRDKDMVDVHFKQTDLGSMINILDSLNGVIMNHCRWQAQPAPVFPPETLNVLWSSADGRNYLHSVVQNLFRITNKSYINDYDFNELLAQYYGEAGSRTVKL